MPPSRSVEIGLIDLPKYGGVAGPAMLPRFAGDAMLNKTLVALLHHQKEFCAP